MQAKKPFASPLKVKGEARSSSTRLKTSWFSRRACIKVITASIRERLEELVTQHGIGPLRELFWTNLHYAQANCSLAYTDWPDEIKQYLYDEDPLLLFATGGSNNDVEIIYIRLHSDGLPPDHERRIVMKLLVNHPDALFIFSNNLQDRWHFLNIKAESKATRRLIFRRITIGPEERLGIAAERIAMLDLAAIAGASRLDIMQQHEEAFNVEAITKEFFEEYQVLFRILQRDLLQQAGDPAWARDYALQFLNRCMFFYFIQRKGWPGGDKDFLRTFWRSYYHSEHEKDTFFTGWLQVLFFEAFNNKFGNSHTQFPDTICDVLRRAPYLDGGLFAANKLDTQHPFVITDERFLHAFNFFEQFNFSIAEDSPLDQEVSIDPEMIGKVYESLLNASTELNERDDAGIFYTPRSEVDLMCRLAIVDYLANHIGQSHKGILYDAVFALEPHEKSASDDVLSTYGLWEQFDHYLRQITVVDPACGSGAFLVGMLHVLDDLQTRVNRRRSVRENSYARKKRIIEQSLYGVDVMEWAAHVTELRLWLTLIVDADISSDSDIHTPEQRHTRRDSPMSHLSFKVRVGDSLVQQRGHLQIGHHEQTKGGFDIVIGNPPYVRQEQIANPRQPGARAAATKQEYKDSLAYPAYQAFPRFFLYNATTGKAARKIDAKSDLYVYFYLHGLSLLNSSGTFCFLTSNSWLDVGYGAGLQEFLLQYCQIKMILDNQARRSFSAADVNTIIALFSAPFEKPGNVTLRHIARFVTLKVGFEQALSGEIFRHIETAQERTSTDLYRVYPVSQGTLLRDGTTIEAVVEKEPTLEAKRDKGSIVSDALVKEAQERYTGSKWGGKYLRSPAIYWTILEKGRGKLVRLSDIAEVRFGIKTGANEFFYLDEVKARQWQIEPKFLQPVIKSPRECKSILIEPSTLKNRLFMCHQSQEELKGTGALEYIRWGESQGFHCRPSCAARARWWDLGVRHFPVLAFNYLIDSTAKTFYAPYGCYFSDNFQELYIPHNVQALCASLNSTLFQLMVNIAGRANFGDGLLKIQTYEVSDLLCLNPLAIEINNDAIFSSTSWDVLHPSSDRRTLDTIVFDALNLTQSERNSVYDAVIELVSSRFEKAQSLR